MMPTALRGPGSVQILPSSGGVANRALCEPELVQLPTRSFCGTVKQKRIPLRSTGSVTVREICWHDGKRAHSDDRLPRHSCWEFVKDECMGRFYRKQVKIGALFYF